MSAPRIHWDVFCHAVDNLGDVGVCWRVARQLARDHGQAPRLWTDAPEILARMVPGYQADGRAQTLDGVEIRRWSDPFPDAAPADVVLETFGCGLPPAFLDAMAARPRPPVWINLEHLSAEDWVGGCHGLASRHPRLPLTCYFFFPGFGPGTGGLAREADLIARRDAFHAQGGAARFWSGLGLTTPQPGEIKISLFAYAQPEIPALLAAWAAGPSRVVCVIPEGPAVAAAAAFFGDQWRNGRGHSGRLEARALPFVPQSDFDELLWACDLNFVRGEDSFLRAQWASRPFVWQIYPQTDGAHWPKLRAFLGRYTTGLAPGTRDALGAFWEAWNRGEAAGPAWTRLVPALPELDRHARQWADGLAGEPDLVTELVAFAQERLK